MTDLDRLLDGSPSPRTRALLRAGQTETSPDQFAERLLASVAAAAAVGSVTTAAAGSLSTGAKVGGAVSGAAAGSGAAPGLALVAAKWVAVGVLGGGILAASADLALSPKRAPARAPTEASGAVVRPATSPANDVAQHAPAPAEPAASPASPGSMPTVQPGAGAVAAASATRSGQLGREVELIDRVRRALASGNSSLALSELDAYARVASTGVLDREARVLRIQALRDAGDVAGARKLTAQYLADFPNDAHAARLRAQDSKATP
ncbi:MAG TPA: hypothetical protein VNG33_16855 [Polyangiaceae bacterium]|nr:hypothetical protein [Polyangiaceae bacterium]